MNVNIIDLIILPCSFYVIRRICAFGLSSLQDRQKEFFSKAANLSEGDRQKEYEGIRKDYKKVLEESKEKIQIAEESYALVDRYLRKLDQELHKFQVRSAGLHCTAL